MSEGGHSGLREKREEEVEATARALEDSLRMSNSGQELHVEYKRGDFLPQNTILVFDLHHVLMRPSYRNMAKSILRHPNKSDLLKVVSSRSVFLPMVSRLGKETPEKTMKELEESLKHHKHSQRVESSLSPLIVDICNSQDPDMPTFQLIGTLTKCWSYS